MDVNELRLFEYDRPLIQDQITALRSIEINLTDNCNRSCSMCPQSVKNWVRKPGTFSIELAEILNDQLRSIHYDGQVSLTGFGEPILHKNLSKIAGEISRDIQLGWLEVNTNGDGLTLKNGEDLIANGVTHFTISLYDEDLSEYYLNLFNDLPVELSFKHLYSGSDYYINRVDQVVDPQPLKILKRCNYPFYRLMIDIDGQVLLCSNDWRRKTNFGNIRDHSIRDIWLSDQFKQYRDMLHRGIRDSIPCSNCDIGGTRYGNKSYRIFYP